MDARPALILARGVVAFLLFPLPKPSVEAEQRQQMVPRALRPVLRSNPNPRHGFFALAGLVAAAGHENIRALPRATVSLLTVRRSQIASYVYGCCSIRRW
jgi:hypothetical protein